MKSAKELLASIDLSDCRENPERVADALIAAARQPDAPEWLRVFWEDFDSDVISH